MTDGQNQRMQDPVLTSIQDKLETILEALNGNPAKDIEGVRPRLRAVENDLKKVVLLVDGENVLTRLNAIEAQQRTLVDIVVKGDVSVRMKATENGVRALEDERKLWKAYALGIGAGVGVTGITSTASIVLQVIKWLNGLP